MDELLRWRFMAHLASVLLSAPPTSALSALKTLMLEPQRLMEGQPCFLPGMDEDIRNRVMKALLERGENIWKFKTHWYKCICGYTFFIGECGRPMEVATCPQCGRQIGGKNHIKTQDTQEDDETDKSPWGYMLPAADGNEKHISFREIPATSARIIRLLLHSSMFLGIASAAKSPMSRVYSQIVNDESMCNMNQQEEAIFIGAHVSNDWQQMVDLLSSNVEDLTASLHALLRTMSLESKDDMKAVKPPAAPALAAQMTRAQLAGRP